MDRETTSAAARKWRLRLVSLAGMLATVGIALLIRQGWHAPAAEAQAPLKRSPAKTVAAKNVAAKKPKSDVEADAPPVEVPRQENLAVMAIVNGERIERAELARECLRHYGEAVLETIVNKRLIAAECLRRNIAVTREEVKEEMDRMAQRFGLQTDQFLSMLKEERHFTSEQYSKEVIWPTVALRKLASNQLKVTEKDFQEAYDMLYGPAIQARLIACATAKDAEKRRAQAVANPEEFGNLAKQFSIDTVSASAKGLIQPIHHHQGDKNIERVAFGLKDGEISEVIAVGDQFVILKCEAHLAPQKVDRTKVAKVLEESIRDKKLRLQAGAIFEKLQNNAQIENIFNDPAQSKQHPGVAAIVNGESITVREVAEECLSRHGVDMLDGLISKHILKQALKRRKIEVTEDDMLDEIGRIAVAMGRTTKDDKPDIEAWLKDVAEKQKFTTDIYRDDVVWPSVALRKLAGEKIDVTQDDLKKSFEANYGPRVRCRAIVLNNQRRAQAVWEAARKKPTVENFADLARQYTIEPGGKVNDGEIPPIQRYSTEPLLEQEAFSLKTGEVSGIVQVEDKWVILFCEGYTKPIGVKYKDVEKLMLDDIRDKKLRLVMAQQYQKLQDDARIENFLAGKVQGGSKANQAGDSLLNVPDGTLLAPDNPEPAPKGAAKPKPSRAQVR